jgi:hypothetical protein
MNVNVMVDVNEGNEKPLPRLVQTEIIPKHSRVAMDGQTHLYISK